MMSNKGENMKLSELVNEVNQEQDLMYLVNDLCDKITKATHKRWKHTRETTTTTYKVGPKYIKIISCENAFMLNKNNVKVVKNMHFKFFIKIL